MGRLKNKAWHILILLSVFISACSVQTTEITPFDGGTLPYWPTDGWRETTPEQQGMDSELLAEMLEEVIQRGHDIDSISVIRNGYLVLDVSIDPYRSSNKHIIHSCTKSIVSALIGIALQQGYLESVDQPLLEIFANREVVNLSTEKQSITLEHLLTMSSGLECRDSYLYRWRGIEAMLESDDWVQYMLGLPMAEPPGTYFEYCNGGSFLLSAIIQETTGLSSEAFARQNLFEPLGISDIDWPSNPKGISIGWGELRMLPLDMAKIGYLYLKEGVWDGEQIVPQEWVSASTKKHIDATLQDGYGYQWWVDTPDVYMALGYAGQFIFVAPENDLIAVFTSDLSESEFYTPQRLLDNFILPALISSKPLSKNQVAFEALTLQIETLENP
jgi:CubicO group peptidase (beta-lactamase class C family)